MICVCGVAHEHERVCQTLQSLHDLFSMHDLHRKVDKIMGALEDLQAANAAEAAELTQFLNDIAGQVSGGVSAADAEAIVTAINGRVAAMQAADPVQPVTPPAAT